MATLKLTFFGSPQLFLGEHNLTEKITGKAFALFSYLVVTGQTHNRDLLADLLWSELSNQQARNNLRYLLPDLRRIVNDYLVITPQAIGFNRTCPHALDAEILRATLTAKPEQIQTAELQTALNLYQGEFLAGFTVRNAPVFEAWLTRIREEFHTLAVRGFYQLAERYWQAYDYDAGLAATQRLLTLEPWCEAGHRLRMLFLVHSNQRGDALAQFTRCQQILAEEVGAEPEPETVSLYEQIRKGIHNEACHAAEGRPAKTTNQSVAPALPHNLPSQLTPFLGREEEVAALCDKLLAPDSRLLTLVGEGGVGKTRLALEVGQRILGTGDRVLDDASSQPPQTPSKTQALKFPDGVWFVSLSGISSQGDSLNAIGAAIGEALNIHFTGNEPLTQQLLLHLRHRKMLLIIDNFEHLVKNADLVLDLLRAAPGVRVLVTSRQKLDFQAEIVWQVEGLPVPPADVLPILSLSDLNQYASIALFYERAQRAQRTFTLNEESCAAIACICQQVAGLPLGIELAAALTSRYTVAEIAHELAKNYKILTTEFRDLPPRHRSLQATLTYSWHLLDPEIADVLAQCALFQGSFDRNAGSIIADASPLQLTALKDLSLISQVQVHSGHERYELHSMVQQFANEQLVQRPMLLAQATDRYCRYYLELLARLETSLLNEAIAQQQVWIELENIRMAWTHSTIRENTGLLAQGLNALVNFYEVAGLRNEAVQLLQMAIECTRQKLAVASTNQCWHLLARLLAAAARFYRMLGQLEESEALANEALSIGQQTNNPLVQALAYQELIRAAHVRGQYTTMHTLAQHGLKAAHQANVPDIEAVILDLLGVAFSVRGEYQASVDHQLAALACLQDAPNAYQESSISAHLGFTYSYQREFMPALHYISRSITLAQIFNTPYNLSVAYIFLGDLWRELGVYDRAQQAYLQAQPHIQTLQGRYWQAWWYVSSGHLALVQGNLPTAQENYEAALRLAQEGQMVSVERWVLTNLGHLLVTQGQGVEAEQFYRHALSIQQSAGLIMNITDAMAGLAELLLLREEFAAAQEQVEAILAAFDRYGLLVAETPFQVYQTCYRVLAANADPRALGVLQQAYDLLLQQAEKLLDDKVRRAFLENVAVNRNLLAAAQAADIVSNVAIPLMRQPTDHA